MGAITGGVEGTGATAPRTLELRRGEASPATFAKLQQISHGFEALFAHSLLGELLRPLEEAGFGGSGAGASVVQGMFETNLADHIAGAGGLGIGRMVERAMKPWLAAEEVSADELAHGLRAAHGPAKEGEGTR